MSKGNRHAGRKHGRAFAPALLVTLVLAGCGNDPITPAPGTIVEVAANAPELSTLVSAVQAAELTATLEGPGPFTVFAPVNSAFAALEPAQVERLLAEGNRSLLQKVLGYHVVPGRIRAADLTEGATVTTVEGSRLTIRLGGGARVNGAAIIATDIEASNGVVHLIDAVLTDHLDLVDVAVLNGFDAAPPPPPPSRSAPAPTPRARGSAAPRPPAPRPAPAPPPASPSSPAPPPRSAAAPAASPASPASP
jgi:hypothetical protein